jgi:8-oxo-dGTP pyrophosphatase MutT (NUDIX family)
MTEVRDDQLPRDVGKGGAIAPSLAASTIVLRNEPFEVLLLRRTEASTFVPGSWIFPGGALEEVDRRIGAAIGSEDELSLMKICAIRETFEESGIWLGAKIDEDLVALRKRLLSDVAALEAHASAIAFALPQLVLTSRWVTPEGMPKRYDTFFFLAVAAEGAVATIDEIEATDILWITPDEALQRHRRRELALLFPTIRNLEALRGFTSMGQLLESRRNATIETTRPVLVIEEGKKRIFIPGEA